MLKWKGSHNIFGRKTMRGIILEKGKFDTYDPPTGQSCRIIISPWMSCMLWGTAGVKFHENSHQVKWLPMEHTKTKTVICHLLPAGYGMKRISTTTKENETGTALYGQMTVWFLLPMTIITRFMKLFKKGKQYGTGRSISGTYYG